MMENYGVRARDRDSDHKQKKQPEWGREEHTRGWHFPTLLPGQDHRGQKEEVESPEYEALRWFTPPCSSPDIELPLLC